MGYIPSDVSNSSTYVFPLQSNGCIDPNFQYTAPYNPPYRPPLYAGAPRRIDGSLPIIIVVSLAIATILLSCIIG